MLKYVRDEFRCETCSIKRGPDPRRRATCPRTFSFNKVLSIDVFFVSFKGSSEPILNIVCHGTNYQLAHRIESTSGAPSAQATWKAMLTTWIRHLGAPSLVITDGGKEFQGRFERGLEQLGILQHVTAPESPWQNSRAERHGGWLKQKLVQELDSGRGVVTSREDLDELLASLVSVKNRWFNHGGYTPAQMVFGELPRIPGELLSSDESGMQALSDAFHDPAGMDEAAVEFKRRHQIRERARQLAMEETSREVIKRAVRTSSYPCRSWSAGQWVYCFRRGRNGDALHPTSRWVGPGIVVMQTPSVVWVAMRTRLWRCAPEQLRAAFPSEVLGRQLASDPQFGDLLRKVVSGSHAGALDVTRDIPTANEDHFAPVDAEPALQGLPVSSSTAPTSVEPPPLEPPQAPREVLEVPPGLERRVGPLLERVPEFPENTVSRRSSLQEPAQEPEARGESPDGEAERPDRLTEASAAPQVSASGSSGIDERPSKVPRMLEGSGGEGVENRRAPGTPITRLLQAVRRGRELTTESIPENAESRSRSRTPDGSDQLFGKMSQQAADTSWFSYEEESGWVLVASRSDEVDVKRLSLEEQERFQQSDKIEWDAILKTKAVRVAYGKEAQRIRELYPDRILASRMVRRKKPLPGSTSGRRSRVGALPGTPTRTPSI